jgi:hypothetical protein
MKRKSSFLMQKVAEETLLVPFGAQVIDMNGIVILNSTGQCLWESLSEECSLDDLVSVIVKQFEVGEEQAREDIQNFLTEIKRIGLLEI